MPQVWRTILRRLFQQNDKMLFMRNCAFAEKGDEMITYKGRGVPFIAEKAAEALNSKDAVFSDETEGTVMEILGNPKNYSRSTVEDTVGFVQDLAETPEDF
jgi:hypothetical protein